MNGDSFTCEDELEINLSPGPGPPEIWNKRGWLEPWTEQMCGRISPDFSNHNPDLI